jgi:hypothetical protein
LDVDVVCFDVVIGCTSDISSPESIKSIISVYTIILGLYITS